MTTNLYAPVDIHLTVLEVCDTGNWKPGLFILLRKSEKDTGRDKQKKGLVGEGSFADLEVKAMKAVGHKNASLVCSPTDAVNRQVIYHAIKV